MSNLNLSLVVYDIPAYRNIPNPSRIMRRVGIRINLSCWIIPNHLIPWETLKELADAGATWYAEKISFENMDRMLDIAKANLTRELAETQESLNRIMAVSETRRANEERTAANANEQAKANRDHWNRLRQQTYLVRQLLDDLAHAAGIFGIDIKPSLLGTRDVCESIRAAAYAKAAGYVRGKKVVEKKYPAMAKAMEAGEIHPAIVADFLDDEGDTEEAESMRLVSM